MTRRRPEVRPSAALALALALTGLLSAGAATAAAQPQTEAPGGRPSQEGVAPAARIQGQTPGQTPGQTQGQSQGQIPAPTASDARDQAAAGASDQTSYGRGADPLEPLNRDLYLVGGALDIVIIRPAAVVYAHAAPKIAREGIHNVLSNLGEPVNFANRVLQLRPKPAVRVIGRFVVNSTLGIAGVFDVADAAGLKASDTSFGQTLARYGVAQGAYLFLPILGPSSVRDATGKVVDIFLDPLTWTRFRSDTYILGARAALTGLDARVAADPALKEVQRTSTDPYATLRAAYLQHAAFRSGGGRLDVKALPDFGPEPSAPGAPSDGAAPPPSAPKTDQ